MKKSTFLFTNFILATCLSLAGLTISVNAQEAENANLGNQFYIGLNLVQVSYREYNATDFGSPDDDMVGTLTQEASPGTLLTIGKELNEQLSVELGIKNYGETKVTYKAADPDGNTATTNLTGSVSSTLIGAKYNFNRQEKFNLYGKVGLESWENEGKSSSTLILRTGRFPDGSNILSDSNTSTEKGSDIVLAVGIDFLTKIGVFQAELAPRSFKPKEGGEEYLSSNFTLGYHYKF